MSNNAIKLRVTRRHHTHKGTTYRVGEVFEGTESLLTAFGDRLEPAYLQEARDKAKVEAEAVETEADETDEAQPPAPVQAAPAAPVTVPPVTPPVTLPPPPPATTAAPAAKTGKGK